MPKQIYDDSDPTFNNVINYYTYMFGLPPAEAVKQAEEDRARGPNSNIWQARSKQADEWQYRHEKEVEAKTPRPLDNTVTASDPYAAPPLEPNPESAMNNPYLADSKAGFAQDKLRVRREKLGPVPEQPGFIRPPSTNPTPEDVMLDPQLSDPAGAKAQDALNQRREKLSAIPPSTKPDVDLGTMYKFYHDGMNLDPKSAMHLAAEDYQRGIQSKAYGNAKAETPQPPPHVPIAPTPLKPAAPTHAHLEDANLSAWQTLAQYLGYQGNSRQ